MTFFEFFCKVTAHFSIFQQEKLCKKLCNFIWKTKLPVPSHSWIWRNQIKNLYLCRQNNTIMKKSHLFLLFLSFSCACIRRPSCPDMNEEKALEVMQDVSERNRKYQPLTERDDTMMQRVIAYYKEHGTSNELMEAYYLLGSVYRDLHEAPKAMEAFLEGINAADTTAEDCQYNILARLYGQKCDLLYQQSLHRQAMEEEKNVYKYAIKANDTLMMVASQWERLGKCFVLGDYQTIADESWTVLEESQRLGQYQRAAHKLCTSVLADIELGRLEDARRFLVIYEQSSSDVDLKTYESRFPIYYYAKGRLLAAQGKLDSAEVFFRRELKETDWNNRQAAYRGLRNVFEQTGRKDSAVKYARLQCDAVDSAYQEMLSANLQNLHELYDYSRAQKDSYEKTIELEGRQRKLQVTWMVMAIVTALLMLSGYYLYAQYKKKIAKAEAEMNQARVELQEMEERMELLKERISHAENEEERRHLSDEWEQARMGREEQMQVVADKEKQLANLRHKARKSQGETKQKYEHSTLFKYLHAKSKNNKVLLPEELQQVENMLLTDDAGLLRRLYNEAPDATETERMMFLLLRLGLSRADVSRLMAHDQSSLSSISNRMFRRVKGHGPMNSAEAYNWLLEI